MPTVGETNAVGARRIKGGNTMGEGSKGFSCQLLLREETQWVKVPRDFLVSCC